MRVLLVHNQYTSAVPSGENRVVEVELQALREAGVDVRSYFRSSDEISSMSTVEKTVSLVSPLAGSSSKPQLKKLLHEWRPDVVHLHNPYPLISPRVIDYAAAEGIPVVATIHNFRLQCLNGLFFRDGHICTDCEGHRVALPGVRHSCYRGSLLQSGLMAGALTLHRKRWDRVAKYLAVSEFVADRLRTWGVETERVVVKPNPVPDPGEIQPAGRGFLFAGRLTSEKGIHLLLDAWVLSGLDGHEELFIAGDGPLFDEVKARAANLRSVTVLGVLDHDDLGRYRNRTSAALMPSLSFETLSAAPESFSYGRPVIATKLGALGAVVDESVGWSAEATATGLSAALVAATNPELTAVRGRSARARYDREYRPEVVVTKLIDVYESVAANR